MLKKYLFTILIVLFLTVPLSALALDMPKDGNDLAAMAGLNARAYAVADAKTGELLISNNSNLAWTPASLTKLVTALVVLDTKPKFAKTFAITQGDQDLGACVSGGACVKAKPGVRFSVDGLFHAMLLPSANNAAAALARSTGLSPEQFSLRMNQKAFALGAVSSSFNEPTGMDPKNSITAGDYAKIVVAAFSNSYLRGIAGLSSYLLRSSNNFRYNQVIKNTDKLLGDAGIKILGAKTGYLDEALYNFGSLVKANGRELAIVVLGEQHLFSAFAETKMLATLAGEAQMLGLKNSPVVLGTTTAISAN